MALTSRPLTDYEILARKVSPNSKQYEITLVPPTSAPPNQIVFRAYWDENTLAYIFGISIPKDIGLIKDQIEAKVRELDAQQDGERRP